LTGGKNTNRGGRPAFRPTLPQREAVRLCRVDGWSENRIAHRLQISRSTLRAYFSAELNDGADTERLAALRALKRQVNKGNVAAIKQYLLLTGAAVAVRQFLQKPERPPKLGKKELAKQAALQIDPEWGDDLAPWTERMH
jgi:hypothetical protein